MKRVIENRFAGVLQQPVICLGILQILSRQMRSAHGDGPVDPIMLPEDASLDAIRRGIDAAEVREPDRAGVLALVIAKRQQALTPIEVAVAQPGVASIRRHEDVEIREGIGRIPESVSCLTYDGRSDQGRSRTSAADDIPDS